MELKIWVEGIQRIVCGVTEQTTCLDVVYALAHATGKTGRFTLIEKWGTNERLLAPSEHPLRVLRKWGKYHHDVQFILQRSALTPAPPHQKDRHVVEGHEHERLPTHNAMHASAQKGITCDANQLPSRLPPHTSRMQSGPPALAPTSVNASQRTADSLCGLASSVRHIASKCSASDSSNASDNSSGFHSQGSSSRQVMNTGLSHSASSSRIVGSESHMTHPNASQPYNVQRSKTTSALVSCRDGPLMTTAPPPPYRQPPPVISSSTTSQRSARPVVPQCYSPPPAQKNTHQLSRHVNAKPTNAVKRRGDYVIPSYSKETTSPPKSSGLTRKLSVSAYDVKDSQLVRIDDVTDTALGENGVSRGAYQDQLSRPTGRSGTSSADLIRLVMSQQQVLDSQETDLKDQENTLSGLKSNVEQQWLLLQNRRQRGCDDVDRHDQASVEAEVLDLKERLSRTDGELRKTNELLHRLDDEMCRIQSDNGNKNANTAEVESKEDAEVARLEAEIASTKANIDKCNQTSVLNRRLTEQLASELRVLQDKIANGRNHVEALVKQICDTDDDANVTLPDQESLNKFHNSKNMFQALPDGRQRNANGVWV